MAKKFIIIDGHHLMFRAFYATPPMNTKTGLPSNMVYGVASMIMNILAIEKPTHFAMTFDKGKSFRHDEYAEYKAGRSETPDELRQQMPMVYKMVEAMGIAQFWTDGYEADDMIGTLAKRAVADDEEVEVFIVSGDQDLFQLVEDRITMVIPHKGARASEHFTAAKVLEKLGITPQQVPDYKGLVGDNSDNIKGVKGIGPKGAVKLLEEFNNLETLYENVELITGATGTKLQEDKESAFFSKYLATIITEVPVDFSLEAEAFSGLHYNTVEFFKEMNFISLERRLQMYLQKADGDTSEVFAEAMDIFTAAPKVKKVADDEQLSLF